MVTKNAITDLSNLTKVPNKVLAELVDKLNLCIGNAIYDAKKEAADVLTLNIGIGSLSIDLVNMQCKFIPSKELKSIIKKSITDKYDPLEYALKTELIEKLLAIYKAEI